ncbi:HK97 family phage major capsid protein [Methylosinus sp. sav-2]|uniref:phage major capsid protein n=1 Tax=Methylosinus sp. sav-2 TaxID=2485168 RepID=UPI00068FF52E|nr:phage major capsid protein [Methylosinus sp. sav-2]TDX61935.1 HK97 family phage major capsid protein [Methylosinus sp. sav-2]
MTAHVRLRGPYNPLERKEEAPTNPEFKKLADELMNTVAVFRQKNDESLDELRKKKIDDVVLKEHVDRINDAIDKVEKKLTDELLDIKRKAIFEGQKDTKKPAPPELEAYTKKFDDYLRGRYGSDDKPRDLMEANRAAYEAKALSVGSDADGGFTVLPTIEQTMTEIAVLVSPVRSVANVTQISTDRVRFPVNKRGTTFGWSGETDPRTATANSQLAESEIPVHEMFAMPGASQSFLDDTYIDAENWIASEASLAFAQGEGAAFIKGDGSKKPTGFLAYPIVADGSWSWGNVGYVATGTSGGFTSPAAGPPIVQGADVFADLVAALKYIYRPNARFAANRRSVAAMRKLKTLYADYLWVPGLQNGQPASFYGYPLVEFEDMPDIAASSYSVAFADFKQFYRIVDRVGIRTLRDPFTNKPFVMFYMTKRVGGGINNFEAGKLLKFAVS